MSQTNSRQLKGQEIAHLNGSVQRRDEHSYKVKSQSGNGEYDIIASERGWLCSCPDFIYRHVKCKHVFAVEFSLALRNTVEVESTLPLHL